MTILDPLTGHLVKIQSPIKPNSSVLQGRDTTNIDEVLTRELPCRPLNR
jgi:hypothetical protein